MESDSARQGESLKGPSIGIYHDVPIEEYLSWPYVNNSSLGPTERSMAHYRAALRNPGPPTAAMRLGSFLHAGVLEPLAIAARFVARPEGFCRAQA